MKLLLFTFWWKLHSFFLNLVSGIFFILPCVDNYIKVDLRTVSFDVPPQEVSFSKNFITFFNYDSKLN